MTDLFTMSSAVFSPDRVYRYRLSRIWDRSVRPAVFIMLNPSTADEITDDATIRRCKGYAHAWHYGGIVVVNLFAYRATDPAELKKADNPIGGPDNDRHIIEACEDSAIVVCAWGVHGTYKARDEDVLRMLFSLNLTPHYLQLSGNGSPRHPLYLSASLKPQPLSVTHFKEAA
jgi:hypothetical protein